MEIAKNYDGKVVPYFWLRQHQMQVEVASKKWTLPQLMINRNLLINGHHKNCLLSPRIELLLFHMVFMVAGKTVAKMEVGLEPDPPEVGVGV